MLFRYILEDYNLLALILAGVIKSHNLLERPERCLESYFAFGEQVRNEMENKLTPLLQPCKMHKYILDGVCQALCAAAPPRQSAAVYDGPPFFFDSWRW
jgi:hypothetical protein